MINANRGMKPGRESRDRSQTDPETLPTRPGFRVKRGLITPNWALLLCHLGQELRHKVNTDVGTNLCDLGQATTGNLSLLFGRHWKRERFLDLRCTEMRSKQLFGFGIEVSLLLLANPNTSPTATDGAGNLPFVPDFYLVAHHIIPHNRGLGSYIWQDIHTTDGFRQDSSEVAARYSVPSQKVSANLLRHALHISCFATHDLTHDVLGHVRTAPPSPARKGRHQAVHCFPS